MDQRIGFCVVGERRVAYAEVGDGPPLVLPAWWFSHLEDDWEHPGFRAFLGALAEQHRVVRYDRLGTGLSDRSPWCRPPSLDAEVATLEAVVDTTCDGEIALFGMSCGACIGARFAQRRRARVHRAVFYGAYGRGSDIAHDDVQALVLAAVRTHWGLGARILTDMFLADADPAERRLFARAQRLSATPEVAADLLEFVYAADAREAFADMHAPTLVMHRRDDRAIRFELGRRLAGLVPGARFVPLEGRMHVPWLGQTRTIVETTLVFLAGDTAEPAPAAHRASADAPLTARELEVLRLVAAGLGDDQIAGALIVSPHTVHRHVANIRAKLRQPTRGAAAVEAARRQLI